jgi:Flp pilus assembly protein TadD
MRPSGVNTMWQGWQFLHIASPSGRCIVATIAMFFRVFALTLAVLFSVSSFAAADTRKAAKSQVEFGITVAQRGLWQEAVFRWQRATEIDPTYAAAFNNLAIAYEQMGKFEEAGKAYEKALELEPDNLTIQQNFDLFKELNDRARRAQSR